MRHIRVSTVLGDALAFRYMEGVERIADLFTYTIDVVADNLHIELSRLLGTTLGVRVAFEQGERYFQGLVAEAHYVGPATETDREHIYRVVVRPWLWLAAQSTNNRIFQNKTVPEIIQEVLGYYPFQFEFKLKHSYRVWPYCVQYDESDFQFVSRLMELEGIYYWFRHEKTSHVLVMGDDPTAHEVSHAALNHLEYYADDEALPTSGPFLSDWSSVDSLQSNTFTMMDYNFEQSGSDLEATTRTVESLAQVTEIYDPYAGYRDQRDGEHYVEVASQAHAWQAHRVTATSNCPLLACGGTVSVQRLAQANKPYLILGAAYRLHENPYTSDGGVVDVLHEVQVFFEAIPHEVPYRAPKVTPTPKAQGPMTARVVGLSGEEIFTDQYGRVKVQFHWDRQGRSNERSSCWLRVSSPWSGSGFGGVQIPRIGDEVIVGFVDGQLDRPVVTGRVYNALNMPAVEFPLHATQSGTVTRSEFGDLSTFNQMLFDDAPGDERLAFQAQMDMDTLVKHNEDIQVMGVQQGDHQGTTDLSVGGFDDNIYQDASTEENHANQQRTIAGLSDDTITGPRRYTVRGNAVATMGRGYVQQVRSGLATYSYGAGRQRTIDSDFSHAAQSAVTRQVSGSETVQVGQVYSKTVTAGPMHITSGPMNVQIDGEVVSEASVAHHAQAGGQIVMNAPTLNYIAPRIESQYENKLSLTGFKCLTQDNVHTDGTVTIGLYGHSASAQVLKFDASLFKLSGVFSQNESSLVKTEAVGLKLKKVGHKGESDVQKTTLAALTIKNP